MNTIEDNTCDMALCNSEDNGQGRGEAANIFGRLHLSKSGAKPQQEYSPRQRLGYGCKNKLARCKRKRKKEPIHQQNCLLSAQFFLPFALSERKDEIIISNPHTGYAPKGQQRIAQGNALRLRIVERITSCKDKSI